MALIKCSECGKEISDMAQCCPNCGKPMQPTGQRVANTSQSMQQAVVMQQKTKKKGHGCLVTIIVLILFLGGIGFCLQDPEKYQKEGAAQKYIGVEREVGEEIDAILLSCGIENVLAIEHEELLDNKDFEGEKGYRISVRGINNIILYLDADNEVYRVRYADRDLYIDNMVVAVLSDYVLTMDEVSKWQIMCQNKIKELLKSPSSAKFPSYTEWGFYKEKNILTIQGYVDANNSFGANIRSQFQFIIDTDTNTIQSLIFDGEEWIQ